MCFFNVTTNVINIAKITYPKAITIDKSKEKPYRIIVATNNIP